MSDSEPKTYTQDEVHHLLADIKSVHEEERMDARNYWFALGFASAALFAYFLLYL